MHKTCSAVTLCTDKERWATGIKMEVGRVVKCVSDQTAL